MIKGDNDIENRENGAKKIWVKKSGLAEFAIKICSTGGVIDGGKISCAWLGTDDPENSRNINDMSDIIKFIEERCDSAGYPQSQRKLRGWNS